ncbi:condensation domain-containing protein [Goekera deserti]|uniref:Carrier domain-containing protein n=1 Tax=Goekera deserti TaxID=2497753 RepID=A0A7K3WCZ6_9ACTN|nr:condensation domain-containing protein [Goekera deserti]NDI46779.1 hypothetical protein [Goekera deserti]NEL54348.1 hypothetical protein [Goekera deserti]
MTEHPLTGEQERQWLIDRLQPESESSDDPTVVRLVGSLSLAAVRDAWAVLSERHDSLRTAFPVRDGVARQSIRERAPEPLPVTVVDLTSLGGHLSEERLGALIGAGARRPFDVATGPVWRVLVIRLSASDHVLALTLHHLIADLWSVSLVIEEFCTLLEAAVAGRPAGLPPAPSQPAELAGRRKERHGQGSRPWWSERLAGVQPVALPADGPRPDRPNLSAHVHEFSLDLSTSDALRGLARRCRTTLFPVLVAGFGAVIARWTGQSDITMVSVTAGRRGRAAERTVGLFTECLVLRIDLSGDPSFGELVRRSNAVVLDALDHADLPFADLVAITDPGRDREPSPMRQLGLSLHNTPAAAPRLYSVAPAPPPPLPSSHGTSEADVWLEVFDRGVGPLGARIQMDDVMFEGCSTVALEGALTALLGAAATDDGRPVGGLPLPPLPRAFVQDRPGPVAFHSPGSSTTAAVQRAVAEVLGLDRLPEPSDNFFRLGGNSLDAARLAARLTDRTGTGVGLYALMTAPTVLGMADAVEAAAASAGERELVGEADDPHQDLDHPLVAGSPPGR